MYYKVIKNNTIVEVGQKFAHWQEKNKIILCCEPGVAQYLLTDANQLYRVEWLTYETQKAPEYPFVEAKEINEEEYLYLSEILRTEESIPVPITSQPEEPQEESEELASPQVLDTSTASTLLIDLIKQYELLLKRNALLEECILEMSQEIYK